MAGKGAGVAGLPGNVQLVGDVLPEAEAMANALIGAEPGLVKMAVKVGHVYAVIGVNEKGTEIRVYVGQAKVVHERLRASDHPARDFLKDARTAIFSWQTDAVLNTDATQEKKNPLMAARRQALGVPEQLTIKDVESLAEEINKGNLPPPAKTKLGELLRDYMIGRKADLGGKGGLTVEQLNDTPALNAAKLKEYAVRHQVETPHDAVTLKKYNQPYDINVRLLMKFMGAANVLMMAVGVVTGAREFNMARQGLVESDTPLPCEDDHGVFFFIVRRRSLFISDYDKYYVTGAWRGRRVTSSSDEMEAYVEEGKYLYGYVDSMGNYVPGLLMPDPFPAFSLQRA